MKTVYKTRGVCSSRIELEVEDGIVRHVNFVGGCRGNLQGVARLAENRPVEEVIHLTQGIQCRGGTSCPDQLSKALRAFLPQEQA